MKRTIETVLEKACEEWGGRPFVFTRGTEGFSGKSFERIAGDAHDLARALLPRFEGKHILICGENSYEWMAADLAVAGFTGVSVTADKDWTSSDIAAAIRFADAAGVFYSDSLWEKMKDLSVSFDIPFYSLQKDLPRLISQGGRRRDEAALPSRGPEELCKIIFSSGTTGMPKAVMLSQKNIFAGLDCLIARTPLNTSDRCYLFLPLSHTYGGVYNFLYLLSLGVRVYLCSDTKDIAEELQMVRPTVFCGVPKVYRRFYEAVLQTVNPTAALSGMFGGRIRYLFSGGSAFEPVIRRFYKEAGLNLLEAYALTETASSLSIDYSGSANCESVGTVFENMEVRISEPDGEGRGEILVKGDSVFMGYYRNEEATENAFDEDGFFRTGDIGYLGSDRKLYLTGRKKSLFKTSGGEQVDPSAIEELLLGYDGIAAAKVYEENGGAAARIYTESASVNVDDLVAEVNGRLPGYMKIRGYTKVPPGGDSGWK